MKQCTRCGDTKSTTEFHRKGDGFAAHCKPCRAARRHDIVIRPTPMVRFLKMVRREGECLMWDEKNRDADGYGIFKVDGRTVRATRWLLGLTDPKIIACHTCDNPPCVEPTHLFPGTHKDNTADMYRKNRQHKARRTDGTFCS